MNACVPFSFKLQGDIELRSIRLGNVFVYLVKCELISVDKLIRKPHWSNKIKKGDLIVRHPCNEIFRIKKNGLKSMLCSCI